MVTRKNKVIGQLLFLFMVFNLLPLIFLLAIGIFIAKKFFKVERLTITGDKDYVFLETQKVQIQTSLVTGYTFSSKWFSIAPNVNSSISDITIDGTYRDEVFTKGYAWDGCSPKFQIFDLVIGTPDGVVDLRTGKAITYYASMVHDTLYQLRKEFKGTITRKQADKIFYEQLKKANFELAWFYYLAVRTFGVTYWH